MEEIIPNCENNVCLPEEIVKNREKQVTVNGSFVKNDPRICPNPPGRPKDTPAKIIEKKAIKQLVAEYKKDLADSLPRISPVLIKKAERGDLGSIKEINEILIDKPKQKSSGGDTINNLILVKFINGDKGDGN